MVSICTELFCCHDRVWKYDSFKIIKKLKFQKKWSLFANLVTNANGTIAAQWWLDAMCTEQLHAKVVCQRASEVQLGGPPSVTRTISHTLLPMWLVLVVHIAKYVAAWAFWAWYLWYVSTCCLRLWQRLLCAAGFVVNISAALGSCEGYATILYILLNAWVGDVLVTLSECMEVIMKAWLVGTTPPVSDSARPIQSMVTTSAGMM